MDAFFAYVICPLYVAAICGIAVLAVRMPKVFDRIAGKAGGFFTVAGGLVFTWHGALAAAQRLLTARFPSLSGEILRTLEPLTLPLPVTSAFVLSSLIFVVLIYVAHAVHVDGPKRDQDDSSG